MSRVGHTTYNIGNAQVLPRFSALSHFDFHPSPYVRPPLLHLFLQTPHFQHLGPLFLSKVDISRLNILKIAVYVVLAHKIGNVLHILLF